MLRPFLFLELEDDEAIFRSQNRGPGPPTYYFAEQALLRSGRAPAALASASDMYLPDFVVP